MDVNLHYYKGLSHRDLDRRHTKVLLGAVSCMYDQKIPIAAQLREMAKNFRAPMCEPRNDYDKLQSLTELSFNFFRSEDTFEVASGWTDYGDENWDIRGFRILSNPFRIMEVQLKYCIEPNFGNKEYSLGDNEPIIIQPLNAFHLYGIGLFEKIADVEDWEVIIRSF